MGYGKDQKILRENGMNLSERREKGPNKESYYVFQIMQEGVRLVEMVFKNNAVID